MSKLQDDNVGTNQAQIAKESMRNHFHTWICHHRVQTSIPIENLGDVLAKKVRLSHHLSLLDPGEQLMQLWMEIKRSDATANARRNQS